MKKILHIRNFGKIKQADIDLQEFVLFVGDNNSGKTYIMQLIYGIFNYIAKTNFKKPSNIAIPSNFEDFTINNNSFNYYIDWLNQNIKKDITDIILDTFNKNIPVGEIWFEIDLEKYDIDCKIFRNYNLKQFFYNDEKNENFTIDIDSIVNETESTIVAEVSLKDEELVTIRSIKSLTFLDSSDIHNGKYQEKLISSLLQMLYTIIFKFTKSPLYLPSSRAGLHLLYKEYFLSKGDIDFNKNQVIVDDSKDISHDSTLTKPIYNYLRFLQKWSFDNRTAKENQKLIDFLENRLIDGVYQKTENIEYIPNGSEESIPLYLSSSMISELIPYYYFICSKEYSITDYLMIDEAESSLHPKKQFELVRLLVRLNNHKKTIIMSTHSDSLAAKINNIVLISNKFKNKSEDLLRKYNLNKDDLFNNPNIKVYSFSNKGTYSQVDEVPYDRKIGFTFEGFEDALDSLVEEAEEIYRN